MEKSLDKENVSKQKFFSESMVVLGRAKTQAPSGPPVTWTVTGTHPYVLQLLAI